MIVAVLDHNMGNLRSVGRALEAAGADVVVTPEASEAERADALCVPGQGIFDRCMTGLAERGLDGLVRSWLERGRPYLGICLGMQVLYDWSDEGDGAKGLGILPGRVERLTGDVTVPHMGWNLVGDTYYYFDHSYAVHPDDQTTVTGWCEHGTRFAAQVETGPILGVQFHPEKSSAAGIALLERWMGR